jgi:hypothetical protein
MAPLNDDAAATLSTKLDGAIGELSMFHQTHSYYVQGVGRDTAVLPEGWENRLVAVSGPNTTGRTGLCLDAHDLCLAKLFAHREKNLMFVGALIDAGLIDPAVLVNAWKHARRRPTQPIDHPAVPHNPARGPIKTGIPDR